MSKQTVLLFLVALFLPVHLINFEDSDDDNNCNLRAIVEHQLKKLASSTNLPSDSSPAIGNNCISPEKMRDVVSAVLEEQNLGKKLDQLTKQVEKLEEAQEVKNYEFKQQMMNISGEIKKFGQSQNQNNGTELIDTKTSNVTSKLEKMEGTTTHVPEITENTEGLAGCQKLFQRVNKTNLFSADGKKFYLGYRTMSWFTARDWCTERGMQLPTLKTLVQVEAVSEELTSRGITQHFWVSASDIGRMPGQFQWPDGTPVDKSAWQSGKLDQAGAGTEMCVCLNIEHAKLTDWMSCSGNIRVLCELPAALSSCFE